MNQVYYDCSYTNNKKFEGILGPGVYYICLDKQENASSINIDYVLSVSVKKNLYRYNASITDMKYNKDLKGAIWISDFVPLNLLEINNINITNNITYYQTGNTNFNRENHFITDLMNISNKQPIHLASIYIWDPYIRYSLFKIVQTTHDNLAEELKFNQKITCQVEMTYQITEFFLEISLKIANKIFPLNIPIAIISEIAPTSLSVLFNILAPQNDVNKNEYLNFLSILCTALDMGIDDSGDILAQLSEKTNEDVIEIPIKYCIKPKTVLGVIVNYYISFTETLDSLSSYKSLIYSDDYVYSNSSYSEGNNNYYCLGNIYGISKNSDLCNFNDLELVEDFPDVTPSVQDAHKNEFYSIGKLFKGQYKWFKFVVPLTGKYYFLCRGDENARVELFSQIAYGYSTNGLIETYIGGFTNKYTNFDQLEEEKKYEEIMANKGCYFNLELTKDEIIYLRISGNNYSSQYQLSFGISDEPSSEALCYHEYSYSWKNATKHLCMCSICDESFFENHVARENSRRCSLCGGSMDMGFVQFDYESPNSIKVLNNLQALTTLPIEFKLNIKESEDV